MKRSLTLPVFLVAGLGAFFYLNNPNFKATLNNWVGITETDSIPKISQTDSISKTQSTNKTSKREKIPKTIKPDEFADLDKYARETPEKYSRSNSELAEYLERRAKNDLEKARLIYSWIASHVHYDDAGFNSGKYQEESARSVLVRRKAVCEGFSALFQELGFLMDLEVETISGYAKGYRHKNGNKFSDANHAWNAVKIDGVWKLVDVTWGASDSKTTADGRLKSTMKFDPYWFCVQPEAFIFSHLPENKDWQLTNSTITLTQYENLPYIGDSFFKLGFDARQVFESAVSETTKEFVETFRFDYPINGAALPIDKKIERDREYSFSIESEYLDKVMLLDKQQWTEMKREGNVFKAKYTPTGDKLKILVKANWYDNQFWTIAIYEIVDKPS